MVDRACLDKALQAAGDNFSKKEIDRQDYHEKEAPIIYINNIVVFSFWSFRMY